MFDRLTLAETKLLSDIIEEYLADLRSEIASTDDFDYRMGLKKKSGMLRNILGKFARAGAVVIH